MKEFFCKPVGIDASLRIHSVQAFRYGRQQTHPLLTEGQPLRIDVYCLRHTGGIQRLYERQRISQNCFISDILRPLTLRGIALHHDLASMPPHGLPVVGSHGQVHGHTEKDQQIRILYRDIAGTCSHITYTSRVERVALLDDVQCTCTEHRAIQALGQRTERLYRMTDAQPRPSNQYRTPGRSNSLRHRTCHTGQIGRRD